MSNQRRMSNPCQYCRRDQDCFVNCKSCRRTVCEACFWPPILPNLIEFHKRNAVLDGDSNVDGTADANRLPNGSHNHSENASHRHSDWYECDVCAGIEPHPRVCSSCFQGETDDLQLIGCAICRSWFHAECAQAENVCTYCFDKISHRKADCYLSNWSIEIKGPDHNVSSFYNTTPAPRFESTPAPGHQITPALGFQTTPALGFQTTPPQGVHTITPANFGEFPSALLPSTGGKAGGLTVSRKDSGSFSNTNSMIPRLTIRGINKRVARRADGSYTTWRTGPVIHVLSPSRLLTKGGDQVELMLGTQGIHKNIAKKVNFPWERLKLFENGFMKNWRSIVFGQLDGRVPLTVKPVYFPETEYNAFSDGLAVKGGLPHNDPLNGVVRISVGTSSSVSNNRPVEPDRKRNIPDGTNMVQNNPPVVEQKVDDVQNAELKNADSTEQKQPVPELDAPKEVTRAQNQPALEVQSRKSKEYLLSGEEKKTLIPQRTEERLLLREEKATMFPRKKKEKDAEPMQVERVETGIAKAEPMQVQTAEMEASFGSNATSNLHLSKLQQDSQRLPEPQQDSQVDSHLKRPQENAESPIEAKKRKVDAQVSSSPLVRAFNVARKALGVSQPEPLSESLEGHLAPDVGVNEGSRASEGADSKPPKDDGSLQRVGSNNSNPQNGCSKLDATAESNIGSKSNVESNSLGDSVKRRSMVGFLPNPFSYFFQRNENGSNVSLSKPQPKEYNTRSAKKTAGILDESDTDFTPLVKTTSSQNALQNATQNVGKNVGQNPDHDARNTPMRSNLSIKDRRAIADDMQSCFSSENDHSKELSKEHSNGHSKEVLKDDEWPGKRSLSTGSLKDELKAGEGVSSEKLLLLKKASRESNNEQLRVSNASGIHLAKLPRTSDQSQQQVIRTSDQAQLPRTSDQSQQQVTRTSDQAHLPRTSDQSQQRVTRPSDQAQFRRTSDERPPFRRNPSVRSGPMELRNLPHQHVAPQVPIPSQGTSIDGSDLGVAYFSRVFEDKMRNAHEQTQDQHPEQPDLTHEPYQHYMSSDHLPNAVLASSRAVSKKKSIGKKSTGANNDGANRREGVTLDLDLPSLLHANIEELQGTASTGGDAADVLPGTVNANAVAEAVPQQGRHQTGGYVVASTDISRASSHSANEAASTLKEVPELEVHAELAPQPAINPKYRPIPCFGRTYYEYVDIQTLTYYVRQKKDRRQKQAESFLQQAIEFNGCIPMTYKRPCMMGRRYAMEVSLQSVTRECRAAACGSYLTDVDMQNCYPTILVQLMQKTPFKEELERLVEQAVMNDGTPIYWKPGGRVLPSLRHYINNRDTILQKIMNHYLLSQRAQAKELFLRLLYGGSITAWKVDNGAVGVSQDLTYVKNFAKEAELCTRVVASLRPDLVKIFSHRPHPDRTVLAYCMGEVEDAVLTVLEEVLCENRFQVSSLCFDGLLVKNERLTLEEIKELPAGTAGFGRNTSSSGSSSSASGKNPNISNTEDESLALMETLLEAESRIRETLEYDVKFETKAMQTRLVESTMMGLNVLQQVSFPPEFAKVLIQNLQKFDTRFSDLVQEKHQANLLALRREKEIKRSAEKKTKELEAQIKELKAAFKAEKNLQSSKDVVSNDHGPEGPDKLRSTSAKNRRIADANVNVGTSGGERKRSEASGGGGRGSRGGKPEKGPGKESEETNDGKSGEEKSESSVGNKKRSRRSGEEHWTRRETAALKKAVVDHNAIHPDYWTHVQNDVGRYKTVEQCQQKHRELQEGNRRTTSKSSKPSASVNDSALNPSLNASQHPSISIKEKMFTTGKTARKSVSKLPKTDGPRKDANAKAALQEGIARKKNAEAQNMFGAMDDGAEQLLKALRHSQQHLNSSQVNSPAKENIDTVAGNATFFIPPRKSSNPFRDDDDKIDKNKLHNNSDADKANHIDELYGGPKPVQVSSFQFQHRKNFNSNKNSAKESFKDATPAVSSGSATGTRFGSGFFAKKDSTTGSNGAVPARSPTRNFNNMLKELDTNAEEVKYEGDDWGQYGQTGL